MITQSPSDFASALPGKGRLGGLDVGSKTIGLAYCDAGWTIASPAETLARGKFTADAATLRLRCRDQRLAGLVLGLPLSLDGTMSPQTQSLRTFARNLQTVLGLPILLWDERWSTVAVTRTLLDADASRARRAELVDKLAAAYILQGAIDALANLPAAH